MVWPTIDQQRARTQAFPGVGGLLPAGGLLSLKRLDQGFWFGAFLFLSSLAIRPPRGWIIYPPLRDAPRPSGRGSETLSGDRDAPPVWSSAVSSSGASPPTATPRRPGSPDQATGSPASPSPGGGGRCAAGEPLNQGDAHRFFRRIVGGGNRGEAPCFRHSRGFFPPPSPRSFPGWLFGEKRAEV